MLFVPLLLVIDAAIDAASGMANDAAIDAVSGVAIDAVSGVAIDAAIDLGKLVRRPDSDVGSLERRYN